MYSEAVPQHYCFDIMEKWIRLPIMVQPFIFPRVSLFARGSPFYQRFRFSTSKIASANDFIRDIYIKELRNYKPIPQKPGAEAGFVRELRAPPALTPPDVLEDVSEELAAYDAEDVHSETEALFGSSFEEEVLKDEEEAHSHGH